MGKNDDGEYSEKYRQRKLAEEAKARETWLSKLIGNKKRGDCGRKNPKNG